MTVSRTGLRALIAALASFTFVSLANTSATALPPGDASSGAPCANVSVSAKTVQAGQQISFTVSGFPANETVYVKIDDDANYGDSSIQETGAVIQKKVPASGPLKGSFTLPGNIAAGNHWLQFKTKNHSCRGNSNFTVVDADGNQVGGNPDAGNQAGGNQAGGNQAGGSQAGAGQAGNGVEGGNQQQAGGAGGFVDAQGNPVDVQGNPVVPGSRPSATATTKIGGEVVTVAPDAVSPVASQTTKTKKQAPTVTAKQAVAEEDPDGVNMGIVGGMALIFIGLITATLITNRAKDLAVAKARREAEKSGGELNPDGGVGSDSGVWRADGGVGSDSGELNPDGGAGSDSGELTPEGGGLSSEGGETVLDGADA